MARDMLRQPDAIALGQRDKQGRNQGHNYSADRHHHKNHNHQAGVRSNVAIKVVGGEALGVPFSELELSRSAGDGRRS